MKAWLLEQAEGLRALVCFVFGKAANDAARSQRVDGLEQQMQPGRANDDPEQKDRARFRLQLQADSEQNNDREDDSIEREDDREICAPGQAWAGERDLCAAQKKEIAEQNRKRDARNCLNKQRDVAPVEREEKAYSDAGESEAAECYPGLGGFGRRTREGVRYGFRVGCAELETDGKDPAGAQVHGKREGPAQADGHPKEQQGQDGVETGLPEGQAQGVAC